MKKTLVLSLVIALTILASVSAVSAIHPFVPRTAAFHNQYMFNVFGVGSFPNTNPINPVKDGFVRAGGPFPSMSHYVVGLRAPITTHSFCGYSCRASISAAHYPKAQHMGTIGARSTWYNYGGTRVGGAFNNRAGFSGLR